MRYHKINSIFKRDPQGNMMFGEWTDPVFEYLSHVPWRMTEKIDGTNIRITVGEDVDFDGHGNLLPETLFKGRTDKARLPAPLMKWLTDTFVKDGLVERMEKEFTTGVTLFGEGFGAGIQKGGERYQDFQSFILFDVNVNGWWLNWEDVVDVANSLGIPHVPVVSMGTLDWGIKTVSRGIKSSFGDFLAEGVVATPLVPLFNKKGERVITKIKTKDWEGR